MTISKLSRIIEVGMGEVMNETEFSKWLSESDNLKMLGDEIGLEIDKITDSKDTEVGVGTFRADIIALEKDTENKIVIENQYGKTNHDHLGKTIVYAAGLDSKYIIWISESTTDQHKAAFDWLNENTNEGLNFYLIKVKAIKIDDSNPAVQFEVVSSPNEFSRELKAEVVNRTRNTFYPNLYSNFREYVRNNKEDKSVVSRTPSIYHFYTTGIGTNKAKIGLLASKTRGDVGCEVYIPDNKELFNFLLSKKQEIEQELGYSVDWQYLEGKKGSRILVNKDVSESYFEDPINFEKNKDLYDWYYDRLVDYKKVFLKYFDLFFNDETI